MKKIKFLFTAVIIFTTLSCETENEISDVKNSQYKVKKMTKDEVISKEVIFKKIKQIEKNIDHGNISDKQVYISDLNILIDTDNGRYLENESTGDHSYIFPIFEFNPKNNYLKNLLFDYIGNNEYDTYIIEYGFTQAEYPSLNIQQLSQRQTKFYKVDLNNTTLLGNIIQNKSTSTPYQICIEVWEQVLIPNNQGDNIGGEPIYEWGEFLVASQCEVVGGGGSGNGSGGDSGGGSGLGDSGGSGSSSGSTPYTDYSPIVSTVTTTNEAIINGNLVTGFINQLGYSEKIWWNNTATPQQKIDIITHLLDNKTIDNVINNETTNFINELITLTVKKDAKFTFDNNIDPNNSLNFNTIQEFENYLDNYSNCDAFDLELIDDSLQQLVKTARCKFKMTSLVPYYINVQVKQNLASSTSPYEVVSVTSNQSGATLAAEWHQNDDFDVSYSDNVVTITFTGSASMNCFIDGIGVFFSDQVKIIIKVNKDTGAFISGTLSGFDH